MRRQRSAARVAARLSKARAAIPHASTSDQPEEVAVRSVKAYDIASAQAGVCSSCQLPTVHQLLCCICQYLRTPGNKLVEVIIE
jgi:hypothetical protein